MAGECDPKFPGCRPGGSVSERIVYVKGCIVKDTNHGIGLERLRNTPELWGRITESAVGAELLARHLAHSSTHPALYYWRDGVNEVDYVVRHQGELFAFEVKSGLKQGNTRGLDAFCKVNPRSLQQIRALCGRGHLGCRVRHVGRCVRGTQRDDRSYQLRGQPRCCVPNVYPPVVSLTQNQRHARNW
jgi:hypothetical protein